MYRRVDNKVRSHVGVTVRDRYCKLQTIVALSITEAEYMAAIEAGKEIAWMGNIPSHNLFICSKLYR